MDRNREDKHANIERRVQFQIEKKKGTFEEDVEKVKSQCLLILKITNGYMKDVELQDVMTTQFRAFPRSIKECKEWQLLRNGYSFPFVEPSFGRNYCWLRALKASISAMDAFVQSGDCTHSFEEVP